MIRQRNNPVASRDSGSTSLIFSRLAFVALLTLVVALIAQAGGDPWKDKPFQKWDEKDVKRIFSDSPWAQKVTVSAPWQYTPGSTTQPLSVGTGGASGGQAIGGTTAATPSASSTSMGVSGGGGGEGQIQDQANGPKANYLIVWNSSRTVRAANARSAIMSGQLKDADAEKFLAQPVAEYSILLWGDDMRPFVGLDEKAIQDHAVLRARKSKAAISPSRVRIVRSPDGKKVTNVVFFFPKKTPSGESTISSDEKKVEFELRLGQLDVSTSFDPQKMADKQGQDL